MVDSFGAGGSTRDSAGASNGGLGGHDGRGEGRGNIDRQSGASRTARDPGAFDRGHQPGGGGGVLDTLSAAFDPRKDAAVQTATNPDAPTGKRAGAAANFGLRSIVGMTGVGGIMMAIGGLLNALGAETEEDGTQTAGLDQAAGGDTATAAIPQAVETVAQPAETTASTASTGTGSTQQASLGFGGGTNNSAGLGNPDMRRRTLMA